MPSKSPQQRSLISTIGAHALHAQYDSRKLTANARAASPGSLTYWEREVDPDEALEQAERVRRAEHARKAYFTKLALRSAQARSKRAEP